MICPRSHTQSEGSQNQILASRLLVQYQSADHGHEPDVAFKAFLLAGRLEASCKHPMSDAIDIGQSPHHSLTPPTQLASLIPSPVGPWLRETEVLASWGEKEESQPPHLEKGGPCPVFLILIRRPRKPHSL